MDRKRQFGKLPAAVILTLLLLAFMAGCSGGAGGPGPTRSTQPTPGTTSAAPSPTPMPTPTPAPAVQFTASAMAPGPNSADSAHGTLSINSNGDVTIQVSGVQPNTNYPFQFCPFPGTRYQCFDLNNTLLTDASGNGQLTFHFPRSGTWAGFFQSMVSSSTFITTFDSSFGSETANLQKESGTNPAGVCRTVTCPTVQDPLTSGSVSVTGNATAHVVITGAAPNMTYDVTTCGGGGGSSCFHQTNITTDGSGNVTTDIRISPDPATVFMFDRVDAQGFITGFVVP
jgi:hypothetical protein